MLLQMQVILKPEPGNPQELYLGSLRALGVDVAANDIRFVEDNWESPVLGAWGLGWEVWLNGMEITQVQPCAFHECMHVMVTEAKPSGRMQPHHRHCCCAVHVLPAGWRTSAAHTCSGDHLWPGAHPHGPAGGLMQVTLPCEQVCHCDT